MTQEVLRGRVWLVDRQEFFRRQAVQTLTEKGFSVEGFSSYEALLARSLIADAELAIVSCPSAGEDEKRVLRQLVANEVPVMFIVNFFTIEDMRKLFLKGALDVEEMPGSAEDMATIVTENLALVRKRRKESQLWVNAAL